MKGLTQRILAMAAALLMASTSAPAYYYYIHLDANGKALPAKWDLTKLSNNTVYFYVADSGLDTAHMVPGDGYEAFLSELRAAADVWNTQVPGSAIRIAYGGLFHSDSTDGNAGINVDFSDTIPPGLLAFSGVTTPATPTAGATFMPILRSHLLFPPLPYGFYGPTVPLATWSELFFTTAVHEFGHNLGLQHTTTSAAMSTYVTSSASKAKPLGTDDVAGLTTLYPVTGTGAPAFGSIAGKVALANGTPVNMAAVVAIPSAGDAVSAMTLPDGTYEIDGIPPGFYYVYAHSLPPALEGESTNLGLIYPLAADGVTSIAPGAADCTTNPNAPDCYFQTTFYPGTSSWRLSTQVPVAAGTTQTINLQVAPLNQTQVFSGTVFSVRSWGYVPNGTVVGSPPILKGGPRQTLIVQAPTGIVDSNNQFEPGISFDGLGWIFSVVPNTARAYPPPNAPGYVAVDVTASYFGANGPRHFIIQSHDNVYVLPAAVQAVTGPPPSITSVQPFPGGTVAVNGSNLSSSTRVVFDGAAGTVQSVASSHQLIVALPPSRPGFVSHVEALAPDGQSSLYISGDTGVTAYTWPGSGAPSLSVTSGTIPAGGSMTMDVIGTNTDFVQGQTFVGFGTSNAIVTDVNVISAGHLQVTATNTDGTAIPTTNINVTSGLSVISKNLGYSVTGM